MSKAVIAVGFLFCLFAAATLYPISKEDSSSKESLQAGFELLETTDYSRSFPSIDGKGYRGRPMRVYIWYPAMATPGAKPLTVAEFTAMADEDFTLSEAPRSSRHIPLPMKRKENEEEQQVIMKRTTRSFPGLSPAPGTHPLLVLGQGLYYESPLSQFILCEYLAEQGYIVVTTPLLGSRYRLVNINVADLETEIRDMEFAVSAVRSHKKLSIDRFGVIGYDLGGIAGLILTMRNPAVEAFLSMDCSILQPHHSGLPDSHPDYREKSFTVPWMHITQSRFLAGERSRQETGKPTLYDRKKYGESWLVGVDSDNHGQFTSYAVIGVRNPLAGYWRTVSKESEAIHREICRVSGLFLDRYLKRESVSAETMSSVSDDALKDRFHFEHKINKSAPASPDSLTHRIIEKGVEAVHPDIVRLRKGYPDETIVAEKELNWLAYHFLLWWGRPEEAILLFELNAGLFPDSADAAASLGDALMRSGRRKEAIPHFQKALKINPDDPNLKEILDNLIQENNP